jgi:hypothetical protein
MKKLLFLLLLLPVVVSAQYGFHYDEYGYRGLVANKLRTSITPTTYGITVYHFDKSELTTDTVLNVTQVRVNEELSIDLEYYNDSVYYAMDDYIIRGDTLLNGLDTIYENTNEPPPSGIYIKDIAILNDTIYVLRGDDSEVDSYRCGANR